jgi:hypothetical protein
MSRLFNLLLLTAMITAAAVTYDMKLKAEVAAAEVARLQGEIAREKDHIALLKAEWSMLTQPARLQALVEKYADRFKLQPFSADHVGSIEEIPLRPIAAASEAVAQPIALMAAGGRPAASAAGQ